MMAKILKSKNVATRFRILVEVAANQPTIHQKSIAAKLEVTPQAVSDYMNKLEQEGMVVSEGRSKYRVTQEGINWMLVMLREMDAYCDYVRTTITNVTVCAAVADDDLTEGQLVGLVMKDGLLVATNEAGGGATGVAVSGGRRGEDVGISQVEGIVSFERGSITVLKVPDIQKGGSARADTGRLKKELGKHQAVGTIGIEAVVAARRAGIEPQYTCGVTAAAVEATRIGLSFVIVCTEDAVPELISRLREEKLSYQMIDLGNENSG